MKEKNTEQNPRLGKVGGQAVLEGVMMKAGDKCATACRAPDGSIALQRSEFVSLRKKNKFFNLPIIRGVVNFIEMMKLSMSTLNASAEVMIPEEETENPSKLERFLQDKLHIDIVAVASVIGVVLGLGLSIVLFMWLPRFLSGLFGITYMPVLRSIVEGVIKVGVFVGYITLVSLMRDIRRTFEYHGAEHKSVACYEAGEELIPENVKKHTRFHPRCGTSFMFVMILLGIFMGMLVNVIFPGLSSWLYTLIKLLLLPFVVGLGFEFIMYAGKHDNIVVRILSAPGLWMQRLTTREPDEAQMECAITAIKCALAEEFPDFDPETYSRAPKKEPEAAEQQDIACADTAREAADANACDTSAETDACDTASEAADAAACADGEDSTGSSEAAEESL